MGAMMRSTSEVINDNLYKENWVKARSLIRKELKNNPKSHWLLTRLGSTYYEERLYRKSLHIAQQAYQLAPSCPLVLWDYAGSLDMVGKHKKAIEVWEKILKMGVTKVAYGEHGEGLRWARALLNDCRYRIGLAYYKIGNLQSAKKYIQQHLKYRKLSYSIYGLSLVKRDLAHIDNTAKQK